MTSFFDCRISKIKKSAFLTSALTLIFTVSGLSNATSPVPKKFVSMSGNSQLIEIDYNDDGKPIQKIYYSNDWMTSIRYTYDQDRLIKKDTVTKNKDGYHDSKHEEYIYSDSDKPVSRKELFKLKNESELNILDQFYYDQSGLLTETFRTTTINGYKVNSHSIFNRAQQKLEVKTISNNSTIFSDNFSFYQEFPLDYQPFSLESVFFSPVSNRAFIPNGRPYREYSGSGMAVGRPNSCTFISEEFNCVYTLTGESEGEDKGEELTIYKEINQEGLQLYKVKTETQDRHNQKRFYYQESEFFDDLDLRKFSKEEIYGMYNFIFRKRNIEKTTEDGIVTEYSESFSEFLKNEDGSISTIKLYYRPSSDEDYQIIIESKFYY